MKYEHLLHERQCQLMLHIVHLYPKCTERMQHSLAAELIQYNNRAPLAEEISNVETWSLVDTWPLQYDGRENFSSAFARKGDGESEVEK